MRFRKPDEDEEASDTTASSAVGDEAVVAAWTEEEDAGATAVMLETEAELALLCTFVLLPPPADEVSGILSSSKRTEPNGLRRGSWSISHHFNICFSVSHLDAICSISTKRRCLRRYRSYRCLIFHKMAATNKRARKLKVDDHNYEGES